MHFAALLRSDPPSPKKFKGRTMSTPHLFSFYEKDMEKWQKRIKSPSKNAKGPLQVIDFCPRGNSGVVFL